MITLNFTLVVELALFLVFLWVTNQIVVRPLLRTMDARTAKVDQDRAAAEADTQEAQRLEALYVERLANAHQASSQRLHKARFDAYHEGRVALDGLKQQAEQEIEACRVSVEARIEAERKKFAELVPGLVEAADRKVGEEGHLL